MEYSPNLMITFIHIHIFLCDIFVNVMVKRTYFLIPLKLSHNLKQHTFNIKTITRDKVKAVNNLFVLILTLNSN